MDILKKNIKLIVLIIIIILISSGVGVLATYNYLASDIKYTENKTVEQALNDLYSKASKLTTAKGVGWNEGNSTIDSNGIFTFDIGFEPSVTYFYFSCNGDNNVGRIINVNTSFKWWYNSGNVNNYGEYESTVSYNNGKLTISTCEGRNDLSGVTVYWIAYK